MALGDDQNENNKINRDMKSSKNVSMQPTG